MKHFYFARELVIEADLRDWSELASSTAILGVLLALMLNFAPVFIARAKLSDVQMLVQSLQYHILEYYSFKQKVPPNSVFNSLIEEEQLDQKYNYLSPGSTVYAYGTIQMEIVSPLDGKHYFLRYVLVVDKQLHRLNWSCEIKPKESDAVMARKTLSAFSKLCHQP